MLQKCWIEAGEHRADCRLAQFGRSVQQVYDSVGGTESVRCLWSGGFHVASPITGQELPAKLASEAVLCQRGVISFAEKARRAQQRGARFLVVGQSTDEWPYTMTDSTKSQDLQQILLVMCKSSDFDQIHEQKSAKLLCRFESRACPICREDFTLGQSKVIPLPCQHKFCPSCVLPWLEQRNSCPLCRCELPAAPNASLAAERARQADSQRARADLQDAMFA